MFGDGTYSVPGDLAPGTYRTRAPATSCHWYRLSGLSGQPSDVIVDQASAGYQIITVKSSDKGFKSTGCGTWSSDLSRVTTSNTQFGAGTFIVGVDVFAGTYKSLGGGCYWARLSAFTGSIADIIDNNFTNASHSTVTISASDEGFMSKGCGTWVRQ